jgi:hypothetical protein
MADNVLPAAATGNTNLFKVSLGFWSAIFRTLQEAGAGNGEELASQARHLMDAPIRIVRLRETWSGACADPDDEAKMTATLQE